MGTDKGMEKGAEKKDSPERRRRKGKKRNGKERKWVGLLTRRLKKERLALIQENNGRTRRRVREEVKKRYNLKTKKPGLI